MGLPRLVATLGSQSTLKKVNRKAILDVNVPKACETIIDPEAPMALRLQSNLLYGVSRVYSQQCGYILADAQSAQNNIRSLLRTLTSRGRELDPEAGKARPGQLIIEDVPSFLPDPPLLPLDLDFSNLNFSSAYSSSLLSPHSRPLSQSSPQGANDSIAGLIIPTSNTGGDVGDIGGFVLPDEGGGARGSRFGFEAAIYEEQGEGFFPDVDFEFDADGNIRDISAEKRASTALPGRGRLDSDSAASGRVRMEHDEGLMAGIMHGAILGEDYDLPLAQDYGVLPDAEPFPEMNTPKAKTRNVLQTPSPSKRARGEGESSESSENSPAPRKRKALKIYRMDGGIELRNEDLGRWNREYVSNMEEAIRKKEIYKAAPQAKKNAARWVLGNGIGGVGCGAGNSKMTNVAFNGFYGQRLVEAFCQNPSNQDWGKYDGGAGSDSERRRARSRNIDSDQVGLGGDMVLDGDEMGRIYDDDVGPAFSKGFMHLLTRFQGVEIGREAPALAEEFSSAMPWNLTASLRGSRAGSIGQGHLYSSSIVGGFSGGGPGSGPSIRGSLPRRVNRLTSASPLISRGRESGLERLSSLELPDGNEGWLRGEHMDGQQVDEFELYGPVANVDTQTAAQTQWMKEMLDNESFNFLEFVKASIEKQEKQGSSDARQRGFAIFEELLPPRDNTKIVAAQALIHTLSLATKNLITLQQDEGYGDIRLGIVPAL
ncbi:MAG: hypothetical protein M1840_007068 [Geoglossum simile]|nr:MAG: hypothetical protein M1840_007068 [Geoglossum simile]